MAEATTKLPENSQVANLKLASAQRNMRMSAKLITDTKLGEFVEVKMILNHPMETGRKKDDAGDLIAAHFIQLLNVTINGKNVFEAQMGTGIAKNPYFTFRFKGANVGDKLNANWVDNLGKTGVGEVLVTLA